PMMVSFLSIAVNYTLNQIFTFRLGWGHRGLALSVGFVALTNFALLYWLMRVQTRRLETRQMLLTLVKLAPAAAALALVCWAGNHWVFANWSQQNIVIRAVLLFATIGVAAAAFFALAYLLRIEEMDDVAALVKRKLGRFAKR